MQTILDEIKRALNTEDPVEQRSIHKDILEKINPDQLLFSNKKFHQFLLESFKMFNDDNYYDICVSLLQKSHNFIDLEPFKDILVELSESGKYASLGQSLLSKTFKRKAENNVVKKKVSFNKKVEIKYYDPIISDRSMDTDRITENKKQMKNNSFDEIEWYTPEKIENIDALIFHSDEQIVQEKRESENINFANTEMQFKCVPSDCTSKEEIIKTGVIEMPIVNLKLQNVYKKLDFVKIIENKDFDLAGLLDDTELNKGIEKWQ